MANDKNEERPDITGPEKGEFIAPPQELGADAEVMPEALPQQEDFWRPPVRFGSVPVEKEPLGWDRRRGFRKLFPQVMLPFQVVERVAFGHPKLEPNRLFWGDNLHVMRQLPSESIDLIYIDPPFFSGRQYNVIFGDQNELRSFSDIWEGGMPGYLIWLNARLYEMKRLLKKTGSIYVHCDHHASHYIKVELDKIFGHDQFVNEVVWSYHSGGASSRYFGRKHDVLLWYCKGPNYTFNDHEVRVPYTESTIGAYNKVDEEGKRYKLIRHKDGTEERVYAKNLDRGRLLTDVWEDIPHIANWSSEKVGYPTQKPEGLVERVIKAGTNDRQTVADFFCGGGTTAAVAQGLARRWIACDQSRVAVAITADRLTHQVEEQTGRMYPVPDFTVEHWGVYETQRLSEMPAAHVQDFANAIRKTLRYKQDNLRDGIMLGWAFRPDAMDAAVRLRRLEHTDLNFIRLEQVRIDSPRFREQVAALSTDNADYQNFLTFVQPPKVEVGHKRLSARTYRFDVSETVVMNAGAKIINVQWDFDYGKRFSSTPGYSFVHGGKKGPELQAQYEFPDTGRKRIACKVQDDMGGEGLWTADIDVV